MLSLIKKFIPAGIKKEVKLMLHKGTRYSCPFCEFQSKDLGSIGLDLPVIHEKKIIGGGIRDGACHKCGSSDRERLIYIYLKEKLELLDGDKHKSILHIAPERNLSQKMLSAGFFEYICGDLFTEGYTYAKHVQNINILNIPYPENHFDLIICNHVLEHIPTDRDAMKELFRVLKPRGIAILQVPISGNTNSTFEDFSIVDPKEREKYFGQFDHVRIYGQDYSSRLEECGFKVHRENISAKYSQYGLNPDEDIFICGK